MSDSHPKQPRRGKGRPVKAIKEKLRDISEQLWRMGVPDTEAVVMLKEYYDTSRENVSLNTYKRWLVDWGLLSTRKQKHTQDSILPYILQIKKRFPGKGAEGLRTMISIQYGVKASRDLIRDVLKQIEPDAVARRRTRRFKRRVYYAAGIFDTWCFDQHDKYMKYGLRFHNGIDPFIGHNEWIRVWWTNKNPRLISRYYLDAVRANGTKDSAGKSCSIPLTTQSDPGTENYGIVNMHTEMRQRLDPRLQGTLQHRFMREKKNIKSEINWSVFSRDFSPGYIDLFERGVLSGDYDPDNHLERLVFRELAIPFMQREIDSWMELRNHQRPRADKHKVIPQGIPALMKKFPSKYGAIDFKIGVSEELLQEMEAKYAPPDHPVFQITPPAFHSKAQNFLSNHMSSPRVDINNFWPVFRQLLELFKSPEISSDSHLQTAIRDCYEQDQVCDKEQLVLLPGQAEMRFGGKVVGDFGEDVTLEDIDEHGGAFFRNAEDYFVVDFSDEDDDGDAGDMAQEYYVDFTDDEGEGKVIPTIEDAVVQDGAR